MSLSSRFEIQNQILVVSVEIAGTPLSLCYASDRVPGRVAANELTIPASGSPPRGLKRIELELKVAGRTISERLEPSREAIRFRWDGRDGEGRPVRGRQQARVRIGYVIAGLLHSERTVWREQELALGAFDARVLGLGGWMLSSQHAFDPVGRVALPGGRSEAQPHRAC